MHLGPTCPPDVFGIIPDGSCGRAVIGFARPLTSSSLSATPAYENCGYRLRIFTESKSFGREDLRVTALSADRTRQGQFLEWECRMTETTSYNGHARGGRSGVPKRQNTTI